MKTIYKYQLKIDDYNFVMLPAGAEVLCVKNQREIPVLYAIVDTYNSEANEMDRFEVRTFGTGQPMPEDIEQTHKYIGTELFQKGSFVLHFFYKIQQNG